MNFYDSSINAARGGFLTPGVRDNLYRRDSQLRLANPGFNWNQIGSGLNMFGNEFFENLTNPASKILPKQTNLFGGKGGDVMDWNKIFGITGTKKTAGEETGDKLSRFEEIWGQTPEEHAQMYSNIAKDASEYQLKNKLKLGMIDNLGKLGANLGMQGAQYEYYGALADAKNSAYVTVNSKMNPGPVRYIQPYKSYF